MLRNVYFVWSLTTAEDHAVCPSRQRTGTGLLHCRCLALFPDYDLVTTGCRLAIGGKVQSAWGEGSTAGL